MVRASGISSSVSPQQILPRFIMDHEESQMHTLGTVSPLLDSNNSDGRTIGFHTEVGSRRRLGVWTLVPAVIVFLLCLSLPTAMLWYLLSRPPISPADEDVHLFDGAIIAVEGSEKSPSVSNSGQTQVSTLYGLAFATIITQIISITVPLLMGLLAYRVAAKWLSSRLEHDREKGSKSLMFTPLQYGIMLKIYSSSNLFALFQSGRYLYRQRRVGVSKSPVASSVVALALVLLLTHAISLVDLWLHTVSGTVIYSSVSAVDNLTSMRYGTTINTTTCPYPGYVQLSDTPIDPPASLPGAIPVGQNCASYINNAVQSLPAGPGWGNIRDPSILAASVSASNNISNFRSTVIVESNGKNMAVIVPPSVGSNSPYNFTASTYGISMSCQLPKCQLYSTSPPTGPDGGPFGCTDFKPAYNASLSNITSFLYDPDTLTQEPDWSNGTGSNPFGFFIELPFSNGLPIHDTSGVNASNATNGEPGWYYGLSTGVVVYFTQCTVTSYDVFLSNFNNTYAIVNASLTDFNTTSALSSGFITWMASTYLLPQIQSVLGSQIQSTGFADQLQTQLMLRSLALNVGILEDMPVNSSTTSTPSIASRYPIAPLATFLALVFLYCIVALAVVVWACFFSADSVIVYTEKGEKTINMMQLAQIRLTDPLAAVAEWFSSDVNEEHPDPECESIPPGEREAKGTRTLETDTLDMFGADEHGSVVPHISRDDSGHVQFSLRKRYATLGGDDVEI